MKLRTNIILLMLYLIVISFLLKQIQFLPIIITILLLVFDDRISANYKNFIYLIVALLPLLPFLALFFVYLPFSIFGFLLESPSFIPSFIKRYVFGFAASIFATLFIYITSIVFDYPLSIFVIVILFYLPAAIALFRIYPKRKLPAILNVESGDLKIMLVILPLLFFVTSGILTTDTLFMSNGTYFYSKYYTIVKDVPRYNHFPFYAPYSAQGEHMFLVDSPAFFSHIGFIKLIIPRIDPVLFFNFYLVFILFLSILAMSILIREAISKKTDNFSTYIVALGSSAVVLSFVFVQHLESIKHFFVTPIGILIFSLLLKDIKSVKELAIVGSLLALAVMSHAAHSLGIILMSMFIFLIGIKFRQLKTGGISEASLKGFKGLALGKSKTPVKDWRFGFAVSLVILIPLFYVAPNFYFSDFMRGSHADSRVDVSRYTSNAFDYLVNFFQAENPLSAAYPDLRKIDDKKTGLPLSLFGLLALAISLLNLKSGYFRKANVFVFAFFLTILMSSIVVNFPILNNMEYGHKTLIHFTMVTLGVLIAAAINFFRGIVKIAIFAVFVIGMLHTIPNVKANLDNIHRESFIGGKTYESEIDFIKTLPKDGRIITYGHFSNAVDAGINVLTDRYLARYEFKQIDNSNTVYEKIHTSHSWGDLQEVEKMTDLEFANYLRIGGYKYVFLNVCHPVGVKIAEKIHPNFSYPVYQNHQNQCNVILMMNNTDYAEKVNVVSGDAMPKTIKEENGYMYVSVEDNPGWYNINAFKEDNKLNNNKLKNAEPLSFERPNPSTITISGDFKEGEYVVFKEQYFPKWKAYMGGNEVPVASTDNDLLLIKAIDGNKITLKNVVFPLELVSSILSVIGIIGAFIFSVLAL